ncbi:hypothetical protein FCM35_KLT06138 [Carex littledalei]|uniref:Uncharacterized protein n=1 Tax=Carex littledalei TaxID=544730 RepID=A0A833QLQ2_9POAL|nr:hypothetical protein FCM35_KLT06138 [Carex littledalei]
MRRHSQSRNGCRLERENLFHGDGSHDHPSLGWDSQDGEGVGIRGRYLLALIAGMDMSHVPLLVGRSMHEMEYMPSCEVHVKAL